MLLVGVLVLGAYRVVAERITATMSLDQLGVVVRIAE